MGSIPVQDVFDIDAFVSSVTSLYERLISFESYEPSDELMALYGEISKTVLTPVSPVIEEQILTNHRIQELIPKLRTAWGEAAGVLEEHWAQRIATATSQGEASNILGQYPRLKNYRSTCPTEMGLVATVLGTVPKRMAMVGSGPLPLTGLSYRDYAESKNLDLHMVNIDIVPERIETSRALCERLNKSQGMSFHVADGRGDLPELAGCDVVLLASVAGIYDEDKSRMISNIAKYMTPGSLIMTRASNGLSSLLYPRLDLNFLEQDPKIQPALEAIVLDGPTKHGIYLLRVR